MARTTRTALDSMAAAIDDALGLPRGTHDIGSAYGGVKLERANGSVDVSQGFVRPIELMKWMRAYKKGIYAERERQGG